MNFVVNNINVLFQYLKQTPQIHLVSGDHTTIIKHKDTADYINETFQLI